MQSTASARVITSTPCNVEVSVVPVALAAALLLASLWAAARWMAFPS